MLLGVNAKFARSCRSVNASGRQPWKNIDGRFNFRLDDTMKTKQSVLSICFAVLSFAFASSASETDTKVLRDLDAQWSAAAGAKDVEKTVSFYSEDAIVMPPNALISGILIFRCPARKSSCALLLIAPSSCADANDLVQKRSHTRGNDIARKNISLSVMAADFVITLDEDLAHSRIIPRRWVLRCGGADLEPG
jgi:hypothetical protein